ncbi:MAG: hypothetical protein DDG58_14190 [Ardenticatenia bacterium]|jgi:predicted nucleotidyltransferase|nr:MAG: hypothetical protein DDG58_14190 [Ardenticatenia bacterium]
MSGGDWAIQRQAHVQLLEQELSRLVAQLQAMPEVHQVILFGSYAAGRRDLFTDLDLIVVMDSPLGFVDRLADLYRRLQFAVDVDLLAYTPEEFEQMQQRPFLRHALTTGKVLYARNTAG